jgi:hypothetical protein
MTRYLGLSRTFGTAITKKSAEDFYETPEIATQQLVSCYAIAPRVWEPACGRGAIARVLLRNTIDVLATDLKSYKYGRSGVDFLECKKNPVDGDIITNPPYSLALEFCQHAVELQEGTRNRVFMLLRLDFLASLHRRTFLETSQLKEVLIFSRRLRFMTPNHRKPRGGVNYAWYVWEDGYTGQPTIGWL